MEPDMSPHAVSRDEVKEYDRRTEVERLLADDDTVLGAVWHYRQEGLSPQEMQDREGTAYASWAYAYIKLIEVLRDGYIDSSPTPAAASARRIRSWLKTKPLSDELRRELTEQEAVLMAVAEDRQAQEEESERAVRASEDAEAAGTPGVYVYTLPHYLRYPFDPDTGKTLLKVGHSAVDAYYRADSQGTLTALPEDPILLRIYPADESRKAELEFHSWLRDADHVKGRSRRGGREWYVTSTKFLDRIARTLSLEVQVVNDVEALDE